MAQAPKRTWRVEDRTRQPKIARVLIANVQIVCPHCQAIIGTEEGCAHWSLRFYREFGGCVCGSCRAAVIFPEVPGEPGNIDPRERVPNTHHDQ